MNIYFALSITGGRQDETIYQRIVEALLAAGHEVPTAMLAQSDIPPEEGAVDPIEVYQRDTDWIRACDALIAEVSTPSHGVGYEIGYALNMGKPVLCLHKRGVTVSKMIYGNCDPNLMVSSYSDTENALQILRQFLEES